MPVSSAPSLLAARWSNSIRAVRSYPATSMSSRSGKLSWSAHSPAVVSFAPPVLGSLLRGLLHPALGIGVEVVSGELFDGASDQSRVVLVELSAESKVAMPPVEDLIADRMGQFATTNKDLEMLGQAVILYEIASATLVSSLDEAYLDQRIKHETAGQYDLRFLIAKANDRNNDRAPS